MATRDFEEELKELVEEFVMNVITLVYNRAKEEGKVEDVERLAELFSSLSTPGRIRVLLALEKSPRRFKELEVLSGLRGGSLKTSLKKFIELGLITQTMGIYRITPKGRLVARRIKEVSKYV